MPEQIQNKETAPPITKPRRIWLAALLGLIGGPLAQVYVGRFRRAVVLWLGQTLVLFFIALVLVAFRFPYLLTTLCCIIGVYYLFIIVDACIIAKRDRNTPLKRYQRWWIYLIIYLLLCPAINHATAYTVRAFICEAFKISGRSMAPTIQLGDRFIIDKFWTDPEQIKRNDIVVFRTHLFDRTGSEKTVDPTSYVKRVIGLPGETIEIKDERVFINDEPIDDRHAVFEGNKPPSIMVAKIPEYATLLNYGPTKIPEDCIFVLGDNRRLSRDSRMVGPIPLSEYIGKPRLIYFSQKYIPLESEGTRPFMGRQFVPGPIQWDRFGKRLDVDEAAQP